MDRHKKVICLVCGRSMLSNHLKRHMKTHRELLSMPENEAREEIKTRHAVEIQREVKRQKIIEIAIFYGVTHLIPEKKRPGLEKWLSGEVAGLELVYNEGLKIYKIHFSQVPSEYLVMPIDKK